MIIFVLKTHTKQLCMCVAGRSNVKLHSWTILRCFSSLSLSSSSCFSSFFSSFFISPWQLWGQINRGRKQMLPVLKYLRNDDLLAKWLWKTKFFFGVFIFQEGSGGGGYVQRSDSIKFGSILVAWDNDDWFPLRVRQKRLSHCLCHSISLFPPPLSLPLSPSPSLHLSLSVYHSVCLWLVWLDSHLCWPH